MNRSRTVGLAAALALAAGLTLAAQAPALPSFEVASVKPSPPADPSNPGTIIPMLAPQPGGRFRAVNIPLWALIATAWDLPDFRVDGRDKAILGTRYDIVAKADGGATLGMKDLRPLLQSLLVDRFQLKTHMEPREMPLYDLVIAREDGQLGPDMKPSKSDCSHADELNAQRAAAAAKGDLSSMLPKPGEFLPCAMAPNLAGGPANISMHGDGQEMKVLVDTLSQFSGRYIRDKTGLTGRFDFDFKLDLRTMLGLAQKMGVPVPPGAIDRLPESDGSSLMTALKEQLGLKLESARGPVDVLIIDSVSAPAPD